jgi:hypothetical protein
MSPNARTVLSAIGTAIVIMVVLACGAAYLMVKSVIPPGITAIHEYPALRLKFGECASRFPSDIPKDAQNVQISCMPGFLQAGPRLELLFTISPKEAELLAASFSEEFSLANTKCDWAKSIEAVANLAAGSKGLKPEQLAASRKIFVFYTSGSWNHPHIGGVAIDTSWGEVAYFAEGG